MTAAVSVHRGRQSSAKRKPTGLTVAVNGGAVVLRQGRATLLRLGLAEAHRIGRDMLRAVVDLERETT